MKEAALEAFHWLGELTYNARWLKTTDWVADVQGNLGSPVSHDQARECLIAVVEHADELAAAARKLVAMIAGKE